MSRSKKPSRTPGPPPADSQPRQASPPPASRRIWLYRLMALVAAPLVLFALLELSLRLAGVGSPTTFFLPAFAAGRPVLIENQEFGRRFFPSGLIRRPQPCLMEARKPAATKRIFVFGESAAMGDPAPSFGMARAMEMLLRERFPSNQFEVVNVSMTAINSNVLLPIARDCATQEGDVWVIYMGNNEVVGPFGAGTVFGPKVPPISLIRSAIAFKGTCTGQLLTTGLTAAKPASAKRWAGMEMFLHQQVAANDPAMARVYSHFEENLRDMIRLGTNARARIVLSTLAANIKDCAPFASLHRAGLTTADLASWEKDYAEGVRWQATNDPAKALDCYLHALKTDLDYADAWYRAGHCYLELGREADAREAFERALELDTLRFRPDHRINEIIRQCARENVLLADAQATVSSLSPHQLPGDELLYEHVHPTWEGSYWIGRCLAEQVAQALGDLRPASTNWLTLEECANRLALTDWERCQTLELMVRRMQEPPFATQSDWSNRMQRWRARAAEFKARLTPEYMDRALLLYRDAIGRHPGDWRLQQDFARFLEATGAQAQALAQWDDLLEKMPRCADAAYASGNLLDKQGRHAEAVTRFQQAVAWSPQSSEAYNGMGLAFESMGKTSQAIDCYKQAVKRNPDMIEGHVNLGVVYAGMGLTNAAIAEYAAALAIRSNSPSAHVNMARLLAQTGHGPDALQHYRLAVEGAPEDPLIRFNFANSCVALGLFEEGVTQYMTALKLRPEFTEARLNLGLELARQGRKEDAFREFAEAVRHAPGNVEAQFNLGVASAQLRRWSDAVDHFREAARLDPSNPQYKKNLEAAQARLGKKP